MKRSDRTPEIYYYEWSVNRWRTSETRALLSLAGRGAYREILDLCYTQGSIHRDLKILAAQVGCAPVELEQIWPIIGRHFIVDPHDPNRLRSTTADMYRKQFFEYISAQKRKGARGGKNKAARIKEMSSSGSSLDKISIDNIIQEHNTSAATRYREFIDRWQKPTPSGKVFTCSDVDLGCQIWISLCDSGVISDSNIGDIFAGLERHKESRKWHEGYVLSVPAFLGYSKNGTPAAPRWNDKPAPAVAEGEY